MLYGVLEGVLRRMPGVVPGSILHRESLDLERPLAGKAIAEVR